MHTVGVKVNLITRKYTYLRKNRVQIRKSPRRRAVTDLLNVIKVEQGLSWVQFRLYSATTLKKLQLIATQPVVLNHHDKRNLGDSPVACSKSEFTVRYVSEIEKLAHVSIIFVAIVLQCILHFGWLELCCLLLFWVLHVFTGWRCTPVTSLSIYLSIYQSISLCSYLLS